ncbi:MAG: cell division protein FtsZ [Chloroflexi bacterium]|nr:cell division protein FtsZ [Chloroflexota bacterium]
MNSSTNYTHNINKAHLPKLVVLGLGGGGSNAINRMIESGLHDVTFIAANTDAQALSKSLAPIKIQLGPKSTRGLGAGGQPTVGEEAAEESTRELAEHLRGADMVFLTAGMGGGTGTGAISIAAKVAKASGAVTVSIVTKPFSFELGRRQKNSEEGIEKLKEFSDTLIVIPNDKLIEIAPRDLPLEMAFTLADDILRQGVQGISELITETGVINVDFSHIKNVMTRGGGALIAVGHGSGPDKVQQAIDKALHHPLLEDIDLYSATAMIANFTGSADMSFKEITEAMQRLQEATGFNADIIPGIITDSRMGDSIQLILIVTGISENNPINIPHISLTGQNEISSHFQHNSSHDNQAVPPVQSEQTAEVSEFEVDSVSQSIDMSNDLSIPAFLRRRANQK